MKEQVSSILDERYYEIDHPTGLKIFVMPKAHYRSAYAVIGTKYGSIDNRFKRSDAAEYTQVPEGIAHFLEHKLFESEELDAFQRFAATGASGDFAGLCAAPVLYASNGGKRTGDYRPGDHHVL